MDLEKDILDLRKQVSTAKADEARERAAADKLVADLRESGVNPLADAEAFKQVDEAYLRADGLKDTVFDLQTRLGRALEIVGEAADEGKGVEQREAQTIAARLLESDALARLRSSGALNGADTRVAMDPVTIATREELMEMARLRATIDNASGSGGGVIWSDRLENLIVPMAARRPRLLDFITIGSTDTDTVEYVRQTTKTDAAAGTAFGTALPEAAYGWTKDSTTVKRGGHWVPATRGALADSAQLRTLTNTQLVEGHLRYLETQAYSGGGTGENLLGFTDSSRSFQTQATGSETYGKYHNVFHKAITQVRVANLDGDYFPNAFLINPVDYEKIILEQDANGNYLHGRGVEEIRTLWGMVPIVTNLAASGTAWVADFTQAIMWVREGMSVAASSDYSDFFLKGLVAIKTESRQAFDVLKEEAFVKVTGL